MTATAAPWKRGQTLVPTGSIKVLMNELVALEKQVSPDLMSYRWQPNVAELPAIWNWVMPSPLEQKDQFRWRDEINIVAHVGIKHSDNETEMEALEEYADLFRDRIDQAFALGKMIQGYKGPLNGAATKATRQNMIGPISIDMNGIPVLAFQFMLVFELDRRISPTGQ